MKFKIGAKIYDASEIDPTLKDILVLEKECADLGRPVKWGDFQGWQDELRTLALKGDEDGIRNHPEMLWLMAMTIWASRKQSGESVTFSEAIDFPMGDFDWLPEPEDHKKPNPTKARPARKGSGRAVKTPPRAADA
jgi:hypothetical protein